MSYTHLSREERYQICFLRRLGQSISQIATELGRHRSSIARELARNTSRRGYRAAAADSKARTRQSLRRNAKQFTQPQWATVDALLHQDLAPEQIAGRLKLEGGFAISHESIYQRILRDKKAGGELLSHLRCQKPRRKRYGSGRERRGTLSGRVCIEQRPAVVQAKSRIGDWEGDTVIGKGHKGAIVTLAERKSRYTLAWQVDFKQSSLVGQAVIEMLRPHKASCHTVTFDNGKEFADHAFIGQCLDADIYFAHPYRSWERGLNENTNGLLRQYFPKNTNLQTITQEEVNEALYKLNHRPRKCLGYRTPHEVFFGLETQPITPSIGALCT